MKIDPADITVAFKFKNNEKMAATVTLTIGQFEIRGFRVMYSKFKDNKNRFVLYPPAIKAGAHFLHIVRVADKSEWEKIESMVLERFDQEQTTHLMKELGGYSSGQDITF